MFIFSLEDYLQMFHQEDKDEDPSTPEGLDMREELKLKFKMEMPQDLFDFWEFCCNLNTMDPTRKYLRCQKECTVHSLCRFYFLSFHGIAFSQQSWEG